MDPIKSINEVKLGILQEVGNIGAGNAATALSKLVNKKIEMNVPVVRVISFQELMDLYGGPDEMIAAVFLRIEGEVTGSMFYLLPVDKATFFARLLTGMKDITLTNSRNSELALSALQEMGNIMAGTYLTALSEFIQMRLTPSVPEVGIDMFGAIISYGLLEISKVSDYAIMIDTVLKTETEEDNDLIKGHLFLLPDPESFEKIFSALGV